MTKEDKIIKGLECCLVNFTRCNECPFAEGCVDSLLKAALDLIKGQREEGSRQ